MKCRKIYWNFQRGVVVLEEKIPSTGDYGYFLELLNVKSNTRKKINNNNIIINNIIPLICT